jgi:hypothetical protein
VPGLRGAPLQRIAAKDLGTRTRQISAAIGSIFVKPDVPDDFLPLFLAEGLPLVGLSGFHISVGSRLVPTRFSMARRPHPDFLALKSQRQLARPAYSF